MSKGGHQNEEGKRKPFKTMIEWQELLFDVVDLKGVEQVTVPDIESEDGVAYALVLRFRGAPYEKIVRFKTEELRDTHLVQLKGKLMMQNVIIL